MLSRSQEAGPSSVCGAGHWLAVLRALSPQPSLWRQEEIEETFSSRTQACPLPSNERFNLLKRKTYKSSGNKKMNAQVIYIFLSDHWYLYACTCTGLQWYVCEELYLC